MTTAEYGLIFGSYGFYCRIWIENSSGCKLDMEAQRGINSYIIIIMLLYNHYIMIIIIQIIILILFLILFDAANIYQENSDSFLVINIWPISASGQFGNCCWHSHPYPLIGQWQCHDLLPFFLGGLHSGPRSKSMILSWQVPKVLAAVHNTRETFAH